MRLLFVTHFVPFPPLSGNRLITLNHIKQLAARHTVDLISFKNRERGNELGDLPRWCNRIELVDRPPRWRILLQSLLGIARDAPLLVSGFRSAEMTEVVNRRLASTTYDVVLIQLEIMAQFRPDWHQGPTIWNLEDPPALKGERMLPMYPWYARALVRHMNGRHKRYERRQASRFDRIIFVNEQDSRDYKSVLNTANLDWVPHGIDGDVYYPSQEIPRRDGMIVITGTMNHRPNVDAIEYFCREVFPLICKREPSATLWLIGTNPVRSVRKWSRNPRIRVTGYVPDLRPYLRQAMVSVCPIRLRIGNQTKIFEALACGTPVVTTSAGNHGVGGVSGEHLYVADDPLEFADKVVALLKGERWSELSQEGRRFAIENFSWEKSTAKLEQILEQLVAMSRKDVACE